MFFEVVGLPLPVDHMDCMWGVYCGCVVVWVGACVGVYLLGAPLQCFFACHSHSLMLGTEARTRSCACVPICAFAHLSLPHVLHSDPAGVHLGVLYLSYLFLKLPACPSSADEPSGGGQKRRLFFPRGPLPSTQARESCLSMGFGPAIAQVACVSVRDHCSAYVIILFRPALVMDSVCMQLTRAHW